MVLLVGAITTGCGGNVPLQGKVTFKEDGSPLALGIVYFDSGITTARGTINSDGSYKVGTLRQNDGLPRGEYKVYIGGSMEIIQNTEQKIGVDSMGNPMMSAPIFRQLVDKKYMSTDQTPLVCKVPAEKNRFDIVVEKPKDSTK